MSHQVLYKFRHARGGPDSVIHDGSHITALELKNLIAERTGLTDSALELSDPKTRAIFGHDHVFLKGSAVIVRRLVANKAQAHAQQAAAPAEPTEEVSLEATAASADPRDENAQLEQRDVDQGKEYATIELLVSAQDEAWRTQFDWNILASRARQQQLAAQRGRGGGGGFGSHMHGRGRGLGGQPTGFCKFCGKMNDHYSDDCPLKHNPRTDLRHLRATGEAAAGPAIAGPGSFSWKKFVWEVAHATYQ